MRLYYTTTAGPDLAQSTPINSIGGYKSITPVTNDMSGNLFSELSLYGLKTAQTEYKALVLINELLDPVTEINFWFQPPTETLMYCDYKIAIVTMSKDIDGNLVMEKSPNYMSKPIYATFYPATEEEKISLDIELAPGDQLGLWIQRTVNKERVLEDYNNVAEPDLEKQSRFKRIQKSQEESMDFNIHWESAIVPIP